MLVVGGLGFRFYGYGGSRGKIRSFGEWVRVEFSFFDRLVYCSRIYTCWVKRKGREVGIGWVRGCFGLVRFTFFR